MTAAPAACEALRHAAAARRGCASAPGPGPCMAHSQWALAGISLRLPSVAGTGGHFGTRTPRADWPAGQAGTSNFKLLRWQYHWQQTPFTLKSEGNLQMQTPFVPALPCRQGPLPPSCLQGRTLAAVPVRKVQVELNLSKLAPDLNLSFFRLSASALGHCTAFILEGIHWQVYFADHQAQPIWHAPARASVTLPQLVTHPPPEQGPSPFSLGEDNLQLEASELNLH